MRAAIPLLAALVPLVARLGAAEPSAGDCAGCVDEVAVASGVGEDVNQEANVAEICMLQRGVTRSFGAGSAGGKLAAAAAASAAEAESQTVAAGGEKPLSAPAGADPDQSATAMGEDQSAHGAGQAFADLATVATVIGQEEANALALPAGASTASPPTESWSAMLTSLLGGLASPDAASRDQAAAPSATEGKDASSTDVPKKNKVVLLMLDLCPVSWLIGIDRLYLGSTKLGIAKFVLCILTTGLAGVIWGLFDFICVIVSAFRRDDSINALGMRVNFESPHHAVCIVLALLDILMIPLTFRFAKAWWNRRKRGREDLIRALQARRTMKPPECGAPEGPRVGGS